jgi:DNA-binding response OmpR family regulator
LADTILMVGSKLIDQQSVIWSLLKADYQIRYANNDSNAIEIIATERPSAVVLSLEPNKSQEICLLIRRVAPATPLFVIGRERDMAIRLGLFQADADDYIREPFDSIILIVSSLLPTTPFQSCSRSYSKYLGLSKSGLK